MQVTLIDYTGKGATDPDVYAAAKLIFTKSTRLNMSPDGLEDICDRCMTEPGWMVEQLEAISKTLPSSWEFVSYTFCIQGVTRAFTHQLVRTRTASYAQQAMRIVDMSEGFGYLTPPTIEGHDAGADELYRTAMADIGCKYARLIAAGIPTEDARGILPTNILTNIVMEANLRTMADMIKKRSSGRVQGEYRKFIAMCADLIAGVHPWAVKFTGDRLDEFAKELDGKLLKIGATGSQMQDVWKLVDKLRGADK